ncbi:MAG: peptidoglycan editing factor PgeF [Clostridiales bacterium]|jgi:YfiH family protein|nr:peptidoglycan editing factor PgeF [Clostridiales bacterium]
MFKINRKNNIIYLSVPSFERAGLTRHAFSTRVGGVSTGEAATMNFGSNRKDTEENIKKNFQLLFSAVGIGDRPPVMAGQVHGDGVYIAGEADAGKRIAGADALVTNVPGVALCTFHADCVPLFFLDPVKRVIALAHSGWRGTRRNIAAKTIRNMEAAFGCRPSDLLAAIAPAIGVCHMEVGQEVAEEFDEKYITRTDKPRLDLPLLCRDQITEAGVSARRVTMSNICTYCRNDLFYSYRGDNQKTGSMAAVSMLTEENDG